MREKWGTYGEGIRLVVLESPYRLLVEPVMEYINMLLEIRQPNELVTVVVPQFAHETLVGKPAPQPDSPAIAICAFVQAGIGHFRSALSSLMRHLCHLARPGYCLRVGFEYHPLSWARGCVMVIKAES